MYDLPSQDNVEVQDGDKLVIPIRPNSVFVLGGVQQSISIAFDESLTLVDYVDLVGGFSEFADSGEVFILKPSGIVLKNHYKIGPGDVIYVPEKVTLGFNLFKFVTSITQILANTVTTIALVKNL